MKTKRRFAVDLFLYLLLAYIIAILVGDYFVYFLNLPYWLSLLLGFVGSGLLCFFTRSRIKITKDIDKCDIIFFICLAIVCVITIVFPDTMFDTLNYHILNQEQPFKDLISPNFFPSSNINSTTYALGDRLFYPFRVLLGYRIGLILNYYYLIVIYYQLKRFIKNIVRNKNAVIISLIATLSIFTLNVLDVIDTYYVDLLYIIPLLELVNISLFGDKLSEKKEDNIFEFAFIGFLAGLSFSLKLSNAFFVIVIFFIYIFFHRDLFKRLNIKAVALTLIFFCLPFFVYMIDIYLKTGNPVFPYFNKLFNSPYLLNVNYTETRLGPKGKKELLAWPILMLFNPLRANDVTVIEPMWAFGYIATIIYIIYYFIRFLLKKKVDMKRFAAAVLIFVLFIIWGKFVWGYVRYGIFILLLGEVLLYSLFLDFYRHKQYFLLPFIIISLSYNAYCFFDTYVEHPSIIDFHNIFEGGISEYKYNVEHLFDRENGTIITLPNNSVYTPIVFDSGYMYLSNKTIPIMNLFIHKSDITSNYYRELMEEQHKKFDNTYSAFTYHNLYEFIRNLNNAGYEIESYYDTYHPYFFYEKERYHVCKIKKIENPQNTYQIQNEFNLAVEGDFNIRGIVGIDNVNLTSEREVYLEISNDNGQILYFKQLDNQDGKMENLDETISSSNASQVNLRLVDSSHNQLKDINLIVINLKINNK